jgi:hypothetical protein
MWYLWTQLGTKPWEGIPGAERYREDVAAVMKLNEFEADKRRMQAEKSRRSQGKGGGKHAGKGSMKSSRDITDTMI